MTKYFKNEFAVNGDKVTIPEDIQASGEVSYQTGFGIDYQRKLGTDILAKPFPRQGFNGLMADLTGALKQYQEHGFFNFITPQMNEGSPFAYAMGACVRYDMSEAEDGSDIRNFSSLVNNNTSSPKDNPAAWREIGKSANSLGYNFTTLHTSSTLTMDQAGVVLIDASAADLTVTLPVVDASTVFILRRIDNSTHQVKIQAGAMDKIKFNLAINPNGYSFFHLFGAGDYWTLASDGAGGWYDMDRADKTPIGQLAFNSSTITPCGGSLVADGAELSRADYPYLWDFAQKSGTLVLEENREGHEGCFSTGDGVSTFKIPDVRGEFLRALDNGRGVDIDRVAGSWQQDTMQKMIGEASYNQGSGLTINQEGVFKKGSFPNYHVAGSGASAIQNSSLLFDNTAVVRTSSENRSRNIAYPVLIKVI